MTDDQLKAWRKAERTRLIAASAALDAPTLEGLRLRIDRHLERSFPGLASAKLAFCWPIKGEYDARHLARTLRERGALTALPVVVAPKQPLAFREWHPGVQARARAARHSVPRGLARSRARRGAAADERLGPGGLSPRLRRRLLRPNAREPGSKKPAVIGVTYEMATMETIHPQSWDIPVDWVVTERGVYRRDGDEARLPRRAARGRAERARFAGLLRRRNRPGILREPPKIESRVIVGGTYRMYPEVPTPPSLHKTKIGGAAPTKRC